MTPHEKVRRKIRGLPLEEVRRLADSWVGRQHVGHREWLEGFLGEGMWSQSLDGVLGQEVAMRLHKNK